MKPRELAYLPTLQSNLMLMFFRFIDSRFEKKNLKILNCKARKIARQRKRVLKIVLFL